MAIPHIFEWYQGAPEKLQAGMLVDWASSGIELIGTIDDHSFVEKDSGITRWCWAIKPSELDWAISMANRR